MKPSLKVPTATRRITENGRELKNSRTGKARAPGLLKTELLPRPRDIDPAFEPFLKPGEIGGELDFERYQLVAAFGLAIDRLA
jgi:hypothetical protein